jgi:hypothetical protein
MRRWLALALALLLVLPLTAESVGTLTIPVTFGSLAAGQQNLALFDQAFSAIASYVNARELVQGLAVNRPAASVPGRFYFSTDQNGGTLYGDTGLAWTQLAAPVSGQFAEQLTGLTLSNDATNPGSTIDIAAGAATSDDTTITLRTLMVLASAITKTTAAWAVGTGNGCLDTGGVAANTWYHVYLIQRVDTGATDALCSTSATAPTMPTNYTKRRWIGAVLTDASTAINFFTQFGDEILWATPSALNVNEDGEAAAFTATATVPNGVSVKALLNVLVAPASGASAEQCVYLSALASADVAPSVTVAPLCAASHLVAGNTGRGGSQAGVWTNTSRQFRVRTTSAAATDFVRISTLGWRARLRP